jgi:hypothetical protein
MFDGILDFFADIFFGAIQGVVNGLGAFGKLIEYLPKSPFQSVQTHVLSSNEMDVILWFIPVMEMMGLFQAWLTAIGMYYAVKVPLRWVKVVKG